jgi:photosystem II stability/assembly factor-like uncharacterized protein
MLLVGTEKGLFRLHEIASRERWQLEGPLLPGYRILHVTATPGRPGELLAASDHAVWGSHIYRSGDGGASWDSLNAVPQHPPGRHPRTLNSIWQLAWSVDGSRLYAGIDPAGLFLSEDRGRSWQDVPSLNEHATRRAWEPSRGLFAMHSICIDRADPRRMLVSVSAGGTYRSEDGGVSWEPANAGVRAANLPDPYPEAGHNVHRVVMHPADGSRVYRQCYSGTYRSDDGGRGWTEITAGLPSDFGYAIACDPVDPDTVFQIPEMSSHMRTTVDGKLRVYRSRDAGLSWESASGGLPQQHVYVTVLREAMDTDPEHPGRVAFGTSSGHLFVSRDSGDCWEPAAEFLPRVLCVRFVPD